MNNLVIRKALKEANKKQWELAEMMGISESKLSRKFRHELPEEEQQRIFSLLNKSTERSV